MRELSTLIKRFVLLGDDIFGELRKKMPGIEIPAGEDTKSLDDEWSRFLLPVSSLEELEARQLKLKNLQPAFVRQLISALGGRENVQPTKLAEALGCTYNTLTSYMSKGG
jgi:DNA-binding NtrC family response regulator